MLRTVLLLIGASLWVAAPAAAQTALVQDRSTAQVDGGAWRLQGGQMDLAPGARVQETNGGRVTDGQIDVARVLNNPSGANPGGLGALISAAVNLGTVAVTRTHTAQSVGPTRTSIPRIYAIEPSQNNDDLGATLTLTYAPAELNGTPEGRLVPYKSTDGGETWTRKPVAARDSSARTVTIDGVTSFSQWTLADSIGVNRPPLAARDSFQTPKNQILTVPAPGVLANDTDPNGDALDVSLVSGVSHGSLTLNADGSFEYAPAVQFTGTDDFAYAATDDSSAADTATVAIEVGEGDLSTRTIALADGWNLVSVPLASPTPSFGEVLSPCEGGFFFTPGSGYDAIAGGEAVPPGQGLFANCTSGTVEITGTVPDTQSVDVAAGWNVIGPFADSVDVESISADPSGIVQAGFFGYDPTTGYETASTLAPGGGYWVKTSSDGTLTYGGPGSSTPATARAATATENASAPDALRLVLTDARDRSATLRVVEAPSEQQLSQYARPPTPPGGTFDVRFASGRTAAALPADAPETSLPPIEVQGLSAPVTVRLNGASPEQTVRVQAPGDESVDLTADAPSAPLPADTDQFQVDVQTVPSRFALQKSRPNPATRRATIGYAVPEKATVTITVYDVLGRRVARLVDGPTPAGRHQARIDATRLPSGTYFVRMRAEDFSKTRRLTVTQ